MAVDLSGVSTPLSSTNTLSGASSPKVTSLEGTFAKGPSIPASTAIEYIASRSSSSSSVFVYDVAEQVGFGTLTKSWADSGSDVASVVSLQTRAGAGLSLVGRLSQGSSKDDKGAILTAFTTPTGLAAMMQSLSYLPPASPTSRLIIQVPTVTQVGENFALLPTLAPLAPVLSILPDSFTVLLSASPQEAVDLAALSYKLTGTHVIHLFDHYSSARETGHIITPSVPTQEVGLTVKEGLSQAGYNFFDYAGDKEAHTVIVLLNGPLALTAKAIAAQVSGLGVVVVRLLRPWSEDALREVIPSSAKRIYVLDDVPTETAQGALYLDVFSSLLDPLNPGPLVKSHRVVPARTQEFLTRPATFTSFICGLVPATVPASIDAANQKKLLFFSVPNSTLSVLPRMVEQTFLGQTSISARLLTDHDVFAKITADRLFLSAKDAKVPFVPVSISLPLTPSSPGEADFVAVSDQALLKSHSVLTHAKAGSEVLITTSWTAEELVSNLPSEVVALALERRLRLYTINAKELAADLSDLVGTAREILEDVIAYLAFLRLYLAQNATEDLVIKLAQSTLGPIVQDVNLTKVGSRTWNALVQVHIPPAKAEEAKHVALKDFVFNAISVEVCDGASVASSARLGSWHDAAKHIIFPSAFTPEGLIPGSESSQDPSLRPDLAERTYLISCSVNRRLTPDNYDRNVFHIEFDTRGTGLKYEIGEALGVHGWNETKELLDFCAWYGIDPDRLITIPVPGSDGSRLHTRTVFQALQQQVDLFGKPGKSFYTDLAEYAETKADKYALRFIGSPEGSATFKKLSEKDTVTFADILRQYNSAKPGVEALCELIGDIKPRHYSIASAQCVVGDRVDLLVVSVDWITPSGALRYGQCTRYLADLRVGQQVTVSIKPSVMKLPPDNMQPIIMAGLGTGAAPFRAFLQHRAWLAAQNIPSGPTYYYFGSRHQSQEYLYGEEIEAYLLDGTITHAGLAFSRDGPRKVYIQHKMREDAAELARMLWDESAVFYLCGPTWPVPDVYEALVDALVKHTGEAREASGAFLEGLKEEERYVLEVY